MANKEFSKINSIDGSNDVYIVKDASAVSSVSLSGKTLTVVKRDGSSATYTTQDTQGVTSVTITNGTGIAINSTAAITSTGSRTISLASGVITTTGTYGNTTQQTPTHGGTFNIPYVTVDTYGRVTSAGITTVKLPTDNNTDVNVTQGLTTASSWHKVILSNSTAASSTATFTTTTGQVYGANDISVLPSTGELRATLYNVADKVKLQYNTSTNALDFVFV